MTEPTNSEAAPFQVCPITKFLMKEEKAMQHHWNVENEFTALHKPTVLATWEAEARGLQAQGPSGAEKIQNELGDLWRLSPKIKNEQRGFGNVAQ